MADGQRRWSKTVELPGWLVAIFVLVSFCNVIIFGALLVTFWQPRVAPFTVTADVAIGLHIAMLEVVLTALTIVLAVFGFIGYQTIKDAAERKADAALRAYMELNHGSIQPLGPQDPRPNLGEDLVPDDKEAEELKDK